MVELLSRTLADIGIADIQALIDLEVPEGEQVEFKKEPPGEKGKVDPWMNGGKMAATQKTGFSRKSWPLQTPMVE